MCAVVGCWLCCGPAFVVVFVGDFLCWPRARVRGGLVAAAACGGASPAGGCFEFLFLLLLPLPALVRRLLGGVLKKLFLFFMDDLWMTGARF